MRSVGLISIQDLMQQLRKLDEALRSMKPSRCAVFFSTTLSMWIP